MSEKVDAVVLDLYNKVKIKKAEISAIRSPKWETSCTIGYNPDTVADRINIQTITDLSKLIDLYGFLNHKSEIWQKSIAELNLKIPFKWMGYSFTQWKSDIQTRISHIELNNKKTELNALEKRLDSLITVEQRRSLELEEIQKQFEAA